MLQAVIEQLQQLKRIVGQFKQLGQLIERKQLIEFFELIQQLKHQQLIEQQFFLNVFKLKLKQSVELQQLQFNAQFFVELSAQQLKQQQQLGDELQQLIVELFEQLQLIAVEQLERAE